MDTPYPVTNEAYEKARRTATRSSHLGIAAFLIYLCADSIAATCLPFYVAANKVPTLLRSIWHPMGLLILFYLPIFLLGKVLPKLFPKWYSWRPSLDSAILTFEHGKRDFKKWEKRGKPKYLLSSHQRVLAAYDVLQDVPHYQEWRQRVVAAFEENRRRALNF
ncbi:MAG: hypothetical protein WBS54_15145 [Acidobacteriota bacterium]